MLNIDARNPNAITLAAPNIAALQNTERFLQAVTEAGRQYGIAITGAPTLFVMESEDFNSAYRADDDSNLTFG